MRITLLFCAVASALGGCSDPAPPSPAPAPTVAAPLAFGAQIRDRLADPLSEAEARKERLEQQILDR